jgi:hypothetical protein
VARLGEVGGDVGEVAEHEDRLGTKPGREAGGDEVVAFDQERVLAPAVLADVQRRRSLDERVVDTGEGG